MAKVSFTYLHFPEQRERRAELAIEMKDQFAEIQANQVQNQEVNNYLHFKL